MLIDESCLDKAKITELSNWKTNNLYEEIPCQKQKFLQVGYAYSMKKTKINNIPKARSVVKRNQLQGTFARLYFKRLDNFFKRSFTWILYIIVQKKRSLMQ